MATEITVVNSNRKLYINSDGSINIKDIPLITLVDNVDANTSYYGMANPGTPTSSSYWKIQKKTVVGTVTSYLYAEGNSSFDKEWDERATYTYS